MFNQRRYRPMGVADLFDEAFDLYKNNFSLLLGAAAVAYVPLQVIMIAAFDPTWDRLTRAIFSTGFDFDEIFAILVKSAHVFLIMGLINTVFNLILSGALITIASNRYLDRAASIMEGYKVALRRFFPYLLSLILPYIFIGVGTLACLIPGFILSCLYICLPQVAVLEPGVPPFRVMKRAWQLASQSFWRILGCLILLSLIEVALSFAIQGTLDIVINYLPIDSLPFLPALAAHQDLANEISQAFSALLVFPFAFALLTVLYYDFRIRQEGYDMVILADHLDFSSTITSPNGILPQAKLEIPPKRRRVAR